MKRFCQHLLPGPAWSPVWRGTVMFSLQSIFTTALPPLSSCFTIGPSRDSFSIRSLTSWEENKGRGRRSARSDTENRRTDPKQRQSGRGCGSPGPGCGGRALCLPHLVSYLVPSEQRCLWLTREQPTDHPPQQRGVTNAHPHLARAHTHTPCHAEPYVQSVLVSERQRKLNFDLHPTLSV